MQKRSQGLFILYLQIGLILFCFLRGGPKLRSSFDICFKNSRAHLCLFQIYFCASTGLFIWKKKKVFSPLVLNADKALLLNF